MMTSNNNPRRTMLSNDKGSVVRRPLQSLNVNSTKHRTGKDVLSGDGAEKLIKPKSVLSFVTAIEVAPSSSAEMSVNQQNQAKDDSMLSEEQQVRSIFREREQVWSESRDAVETEQEEEDLWSLKRASPVTEDDDEEIMAYESPTKKSKSETIFWENRLMDDKPFDLAEMMTTR